MVVCMPGKDRSYCFARCCSKTGISKEQSVYNWHRKELGDTHLIATWTWSKVLVPKIEFLDAEGTHLFVVIVDELILLCPRHDDGCERSVEEVQLPDRVET